MRYLYIISLFLGSIVCNSKSQKTIKEININNFNKELESNEVNILKFYSNKCESCIEFNKTWEILKEKLIHSFNVGIINIDMKEGMELAQKLGILNKVGIPSIVIFTSKNNEDFFPFNVEDLSNEIILNKINKSVKYNQNINGKFIKGINNHDL